MRNDFVTTQHCQTAEGLRQELETLWETLISCDNDTYQSVISLLEEAGLLLW